MIFNMATRVFLVEKSKSVRVGNQPMVLVPLKLWRKIEDYLEDQEALGSPKFLRRIQKARAEATRGKLVYPFR